MPNDDRGKSKADYDTHLAFKQPHQLWMKPWRRKKLHLQTSCPNNDTFQIVMRQGFVPVPTKQFKLKLEVANLPPPDHATASLPKVKAFNNNGNR